MRGQDKKVTIGDIERMYVCLNEKFSSTLQTQAIKTSQCLLPTDISSALAFFEEDYLSSLKLAVEIIREGVLAVYMVPKLPK